MAKALIYPFGAGAGDSSLVSKDVVGGKGANLIEMAGLGLPVPPGVVIPTSECNLYLSPATTQYLKEQQLAQLADLVIQHFTDNVVPLLGYMPLVSVRSGARVSMPGMMDTLLNVGMTADNAGEWKGRLGEACYKDCLVRLGDTYTATVGSPVPAEFREQLMGAIGAVFRSWNSKRAIEYRKMHGYPDNWGTAVTIQAMVFGNLNTESCSGVLFTRDPATGENFVVGEFLPQAQGEDVVAGVRTPLPLHKMEAWSEQVLDQLLTISGKLEAHYKDAQDIEFTVQSGMLWVLQTRNAKRTAEAAFRIAHDMAVEGLITKKEAVARVSASQYQLLTRAQVAPTCKEPPHVVGIAASPGVVRGPAVFDTAAAVPGGILIRTETSPEDFPAMVQSAAILTSTGGSTSHAAVVARGINKPAVVGATALQIKDTHAFVMRDGKISESILAGDIVTLDGATGNVWVGVEVPLVGGAVPAEADTLVGWAVQSANLITTYSVGSNLAIPKQGRYYLSVAGLTRAVDYRTLMKMLAGLPDLHGVIGFDSPTWKLCEADEKFLSLLSLSNVVSAEDREDSVRLLIKALRLASLPKKMRKRWHIHLPFGTSLSLVELVTEAGWSVVRSVQTMGDLLMADGPVVFAPGFRERMQTEGVAVEDMLALMARAGRTVTEMDRLVDEKDFVNEALGLCA